MHSQSWFRPKLAANVALDLHCMKQVLCQYSDVVRKRPITCLETIIYSFIRRAVVYHYMSSDCRTNRTQANTPIHKRLIIKGRDAVADSRQKRQLVTVLQHLRKLLKERLDNFVASSKRNRNNVLCRCCRQKKCQGTFSRSHTYRGIGSEIETKGAASRIAAICKFTT